MTTYLLLLVVSFLIGSIPAGYLIGRALGKDIRTEGSGNTGATNAARTLGKKAGLLTLLADTLKGAIATLLPLFIKVGQLKWGSASPEDLIDIQSSLGFAAILGHCYSPFLKFKGGKGVATSLGVFLMIAPIETLIAAIVFLATVKLTYYVSLGSITAVATFSMLVCNQLLHTFNGLTVSLSILTAALIISRHKENIKRLIKKTENKFRL